jgi:hypothetical protein
MSLDQLTNEIMKWIIPALPYLLKGIKLGGKKAAEKLGEFSAEKSLEQVQTLWKKLTGKKDGNKNLSVAAENLAKSPKNKPWQAVMKQEIKSVLKANPALLKELTALVNADTPEQSIRAKRNKNTKIEQISSGKGKQKVTAEDNQDLVIRQSIKK